MVDEVFVREKMDRLRQYLQELQQVSAYSLQDYLAGLFVKRAGERMAELVVECAVDINDHFCLELGGAPPQEYYQSFIRMADLGVVSHDLASRLAPTAGLRNRLAHEYESVVDRAVYNSIQRMIPNFAEYLAQVEGWLAAQGGCLP